MLNTHVFDEIVILKLVKNIGLLVIVPKVGTHPETNFTNALKNLFGLLPQKDRQSKYHSLRMDNVIADLVQVI